MTLKDTDEGVTRSEGSSGYALVDNYHFQWLLQEQAKRAAEKSVRRGWRAFKCHDKECGLIWAEPEFEHDANYSVPCPDCTNQGCNPIRSWPDAELKVDEHGNLVNGGL